MGPFCGCPGAPLGLRLSSRLRALMGAAGARGVSPGAVGDSSDVLGVPDLLGTFRVPQWGRFGGALGSRWSNIGCFVFFGHLRALMGAAGAVKEQSRSVRTRVSRHSGGFCSSDVMARAPLSAGPRLRAKARRFR
eukprot:5363007-Pyramimonas_sp.AAC.1